MPMHWQTCAGGRRTSGECAPWLCLVQWLGQFNNGFTRMLCRFQASVTISFVESVCDHDAMFDECVRHLPQVSIRMEPA